MRITGSKRARLKRNTRKKNLTSRIVILGAGQIGTHILKRMADDGYDVVVIDSDENAIDTAANIADVATLVGDGTDPNMYEEIGLNEKDLFLAVTDSDEINLIACRIASAFGCQKKIARVKQAHYSYTNNERLNLKFWQDFGIQVLFNQSELTYHEIEQLLENPGAIDTIRLLENRLQLIAFRVKKNSLLCDRRLVGLRDVPIFQDLIVAAVTTSADLKNSKNVKLLRNLKLPVDRGRDCTLIPRGDYRIQEGDLLFICGKKENFDGIGELFDPDLNRDFQSIFILGGSILARYVAESMVVKYPGKKIFFIEKTKRSAYEASEELNKKIKVLLTDVHDIESVIEEGLGKSSVFIAASNSEDDNLLACLLAKEEAHARTIAVVQNTTYMHLIPYLDLDAAVSPKLLIVDDVLKALRHSVYDVLSAKTDDAEVLEFVVHEKSICAGVILQDFRFPVNAIIIGIQRDDNIMIPRGTTRLETGDHVVIFARRSAIADVQYVFQPR
ncbi:MAG: Trk system potassium transporter TrkA [Leptospiraceae bacterium]|nr:Trk system potassium transporter TrkA [Leptospiraceae bacterium]MCB1202355.1 Trk system potassium transporter TrkA [Leptospiraceae bacterium]